jgi:hypothetical protein
MVRFFDPSSSDPTNIIIRGVQQLFSDKTEGISEEEAKKAINYFFGQDYYKPMFRDYVKEKLDPPELFLNEHCPRVNFVMSSNHNYKYFQTEYLAKNNRIVLCLNFMRSLLDLKENLDRDLTIAYDHAIKKKDIINDDEEYICSTIRACAVQFSNYPEMSDQNKRKSALACAKYLSRV